MNQRKFGSDIVSISCLREKPAKYRGSIHCNGWERECRLAMLTILAFDREKLTDTRLMFGCLSRSTMENVIIINEISSHSSPVSQLLFFFLDASLLIIITDPIILSPRPALDSRSFFHFSFVSFFIGDV